MLYFDQFGYFDAGSPAINIDNWYVAFGTKFVTPGHILYPEFCGDENNDLFDFSQMFSGVLYGGLLSEPLDRNGTLAHWDRQC